MHIADKPVFNEEKNIKTDKKPYQPDVLHLNDEEVLLGHEADLFVKSEKFFVNLHQKKKELFETILRSKLN